MNRRAAWVLSGLTVAVLTISGFIVGADAGRFGFGAEEASGSTAGPVSLPAEASQPAPQLASTDGATVADQHWDDDDGAGDEDREQEHGYGDDDDEHGEIDDD